LPMLVRNPGGTRAVFREARRSLPPSSNGVRDLLGRLHVLVPLARIKPDVVHFDWETAAVQFLPLYEVWGCPVVVSCHGAGVNRHPIGARWKDRLAPNLPTMFAKVAAVHCVADNVADSARSWGAAPESIPVIRSAGGQALFAPHPAHRVRDRNGDPLRLTMVARLIPTKGHEYALT